MRMAVAIGSANTVPHSATEQFDVISMAPVCRHPVKAALQ
jgi:hypothetical protein